MVHIREKSAVAEHSINTGHHTDFNISMLNRASGYMDRLVKEAIQIRHNYKNFNMYSGFTLSRAWNPVTKLLFKHDTDPGKAAIEPAHWSQPVKDLTRKRTGPGINWTECFFLTITRLAS
jgi:hypothetical protein